MNNINTANSKKNSNNTSIWKKLSYAIPLIALLNINNPSEAKTVHTDKFTPEITEVLENPDIVTNVEQKSGVKLPIGYTEKIRNFTMNNKVLKKETAANFTEDFIIKEMKTDRGISKENQLLFIYCAIGYNYNQDFYTGDDGDNNRMFEFEKVIDYIESCQTKYKNEFISYMQERSAEADRRSAQYKQESAEARQNTMEYINKSIDAIIDFYNSYKFSPDSKRLESFKSKVQEFIALCNKDGFDYKTLLLKKLGDEKKLNDLLNLFEIE